MVEQNDNSFDGVINNVKQEYEQEKEDKNSIMEKIKEQKKQAAKAETAEHILKTKQCCHCREMGEK